MDVFGNVMEHGLDLSAQEKGRRRVLVNAVMNFRVLSNATPNTIMSGYSEIQKIFSQHFYMINHHVITSKLCRIISR